MTMSCLKWGGWADKYKLQGLVLDGEHHEHVDRPLPALLGVLCVDCIPDEQYHQWTETDPPETVAAYGRDDPHLRGADVCMADNRQPRMLCNVALE